MPKVVVEYHKLSKDVVKESLEVEATSTFNPTQRLQKDSPMKDSARESQEKLQETMSSMSGMATSTRAKALKIEVERGSNVNQGELQSNDFAKKPFKDESNKKLDASGEFAGGKAWKPVLTTEQIKKNRGMGAT
ncbi:adhesin [Mycoplasmoides genitalium]|uniref:adhesin n=1 Tax=Mycoplasmoides genitalium TaxID=2097 RepID=UPI001EE655B0